jgi:hypothetical protein
MSEAALKSSEEWPVPISDEELEKLSERLQEPLCPGDIEAIMVDRYAYTDMWRCERCGTEGKWAHGTDHADAQRIADLSRLFQAVRDLKRELPMAIAHCRRVAYGPPYPSRNDPEFFYRQGYDAACAFMASELAERWHLYDETIGKEHVT